jgi:acyl carrier protein
MGNWESEFEAILRPHLILLDRDAELAADLELREAGIDSLALIELLIAIEDGYGVVFPDELLNRQTFQTPASLWRVVSGLREDLSRHPVG